MGLSGGFTLGQDLIQNGETELTDEGPPPLWGEHLRAAVAPVMGNIEAKAKRRRGREVPASAALKSTA
jgi:hypothetical protein